MANSICGKRSLISTTATGQLVALPLRCRKWDCPICGPRLKKKLIRRFVAGAPTALLTLTCNPVATATRHEAFKLLSLKLNTLFKRIRRRWPYKEIQYAVVWETTKQGWPHAHILLRAPYIPQPLLSSWWADLTGAPVVDIRRVSSAGQVAHYVAKYLTKALEVPPGMKRYRTSRHYSATESPTKLRDVIDCGPFELTSWDWKDLQREWESAGFSTYVHLNFVLVGYVGPPESPGTDPDDDNPYLGALATPEIAPAPPERAVRPSVKQRMSSLGLQGWTMEP
jgi:hypothetical protein